MSYLFLLSCLHLIDREQIIRHLYNLDLNPKFKNSINWVPMYFIECINWIPAYLIENLVKSKHIYKFTMGNLEYDNIVD